MLRLRETVRKRTVSRKLSMTGRESLCLGSFALLGGCKGTCPLRDLCFSKRCDIHHCIPRYQPIPCHAERAVRLRWRREGESKHPYCITGVLRARASLGTWSSLSLCLDGPFVCILLRFADLPKSCQVPFFAKFRLTSPLEGKRIDGLLGISGVLYYNY